MDNQMGEVERAEASDTSGFEPIQKETHQSVSCLNSRFSKQAVYCRKAQYAALWCFLLVFL